MGRFFCVAAA
ncbi:hypothetical protein SAMN04488057_11446 [Cyclobacterium lianum]|uniref:Uncharacterized protein n=1 Tax=Cyclobacterium lianum TaxID=388280 RepID=A0A1M7Q671_9BACT|nr:hypothetical protein SAMN04488057_11446 [Cyclobacterium lianum]